MFEKLNLIDPILKALQAEGYINPTSGRLYKPYTYSGASNTCFITT